MNVTPMMTGIICSSRRMMYLPTPTPSRQGSEEPPGRNIASARRNCSGGPTLSAVFHALVVHFTLIAAKSSTPKALTLTSVTLSDQTAVVFGYHSGADGKSSASSASAC